MPISYQFLPWVRRGLAVALDVAGQPRCRGTARRARQRTRRRHAGCAAQWHRDHAAADAPARSGRCDRHRPAAGGSHRSEAIRDELRAELSADRRLRSARLPVDVDAGESAGRPSSSVAGADRPRGRQDRPPAHGVRRAAAIDSHQGRRCRQRVARPRRVLVVGARATGQRGRGEDRVGSAEQAEQQHLSSRVSAPTEGTDRLRRVRGTGVRAGTTARTRSGSRRRRSGDDDARAGVEQERGDRRHAAGLLPLGILDQPEGRLRVALPAPANTWFVQGHADRGTVEDRRHDPDGSRQPVERFDAGSRDDDGRRARADQVHAGQAPASGSSRESRDHRQHAAGPGGQPGRQRSDQR